jgi:hypothetical protein
LNDLDSGRQACEAPVKSLAVELGHYFIRLPAADWSRRNERRSGSGHLDGRGDDGLDLVDLCSVRCLMLPGHCQITQTGLGVCVRGKKNGFVCCFFFGLD